MQLITRNPLVSPDLLGITAGAQFGVILGMMLPAAFALPLVFLGGLVAAMLTFFLPAAVVRRRCAWCWPAWPWHRSFTPC